MGLAVVDSRALDGLASPRVRVEVDLAGGLPAFTIVGLADTEVRESRERVRAALVNSGFEFPSRRITVNLAPADLPKESARLDLPIALGILAAAGQIPAAALQGLAFVGELSLTGALRPVRGALAMAAACAADAPAGLVVPADNADEAALARGTPVLAAGSLLEICGWLCSGQRPAPHRRPAPVVPDAGPDLADVKGQAVARRALEVAAAGGHALLLVGPPGAGKSMLAQRLAGLLPPLTDAEALEVAAIASLAGRFRPADWGRRPLAAPHHTASAVALVGGGSPPRPGEISMAHRGVLFLDELPEFPRMALEALREPLETGSVRIARAARQAEFPARFQLVAAMNPCPCGWLGAAARSCRCAPDQITRYQSRLSGPFLDRLDLLVEVPALPPETLLHAPPGEPTAAVRERVAAARERAMARQGCENAALGGQALDEALAIDPGALEFARSAAARLGWSARATHRALRVARTVADLAGVGGVGIVHVAEAVQLRRALVVPPALPA